MAVIEDAEGVAREVIADAGTVRTARPREQENISTEGQYILFVVGLIPSN